MSSRDLQSFVVQDFELVVAESLDARSPVDEFRLVAEQLLAGAARARLALDGERDLGRHLGVEDDDVEPRLDVGGHRRVAQLRHPLTVARRRPLLRRAAGASRRRRRCGSRRDGTAQVRRKMTDVCRRYTRTVYKPFISHDHCLQRAANKSVNK